MASGQSSGSHDSRCVYRWRPGTGHHSVHNVPTTFLSKTTTGVLKQVMCSVSLLRCEGGEGKRTSSHVSSSSHAAGRLTLFLCLTAGGAETQQNVAEKKWKKTESKCSRFIAQTSHRTICSLSRDQTRTAGATWLKTGS